MNRTTKRILTIATAGIFAFSTTSVFANEGKEDLGLEVITETNLQDKNVDIQKEVTAETPTMIPGDFFYFFKTALEKIKLAFTFDDVKEAELLASYALERLAEAEELFENGEEEKAFETINDALEYLVNADKADEPVAESELTEEQETVEEMDDVEQLISQNIIALTAALEKVKNPVAKAALKKNIEKCYAKLAKKLEKLEVKYGEVKDEQKVTPELSKPAAPTLETDINNGVENLEPKDQETDEAPEEQATIVKEIKHEVNSSVKEDKKEINELKKQEKEEAKASKKAAKAEAQAEKNKGKGHKGNKGNSGNNGHNGKDK